MTLDEAIKHAEEVVDGHNRIKQIKAVTLEECKCAEEHRQLAEWLKELKQLRELQSCWDAINQEDIAKAFQLGLAYGFGEKHCEMDKVIDEIKKVITPQPKTGYWIFDDECKEHGHCSRCGYGSVDLVDGDSHNYCRNCGAWMIEPQERSDKD